MKRPTYRAQQRPKVTRKRKSGTVAAAQRCMAVLVLLGPVACAQRQASNPSAPPASTSSAEPTAPAVEDPPAVVEAAPPPEPTAPIEPAPDPPPEPSTQAKQVEETCSELCRKASQECSSRSARKCRANCQRYQGVADRCGDEVLEALRCQASVPAQICSNVVGECVRQFQRLSACEEGEPSQAGDGGSSDSPGAPAGWELLTDTSAGFSVAMPELVTPSTENGNRTWRVKDARGVTTLVSVLPPFQAEVDDKALVRKVLTILGQDCQLGMKIHGRFEADGKTAVRFDSECRNGNQWHGMLRISERHVIMTAEVVPPGSAATGEPFYYSFTYLK